MHATPESLLIAGTFIVALVCGTAVGDDPTPLTGELRARASLHRQADYGGREGLAVAEWGGEIWMVAGVGQDGVHRNDVLRSEDGISWNKVTAAGAFAPRESATLTGFAGKLWLIGGRSADTTLGDVWHSEDGEHWMAAPAPPFAARADHSTTVFDGKLWVIGGANGAGPLGDVWWTLDGEHWVREFSTAPFGARSEHAATVFDGKLWIVAGFDGARNLNDVWSTADGSTWTPATAAAAFSARRGNPVLAVNNDRLWFYSGRIVQETVELWWSIDGAEWIREFPHQVHEPRENAAGLAFDDRLWLFGGLNRDSIRFGDAWWTSSGKLWQRGNRSMAGTSASIRNHAAATLNGVHYAIGGRSSHSDATRGAPRKSFDGTYWHPLGETEVSEREGHTLTGFNGKLLLIGGKDYDGVLRNDVWSSEDGDTWTLETASAEFSPRWEHTVTAFEGRLWLVAGETGTGHAKDVWSSADGVQWKLETAGAFPPRRAHSCVEHNGRLWVIGGAGSNLTNTLYSSADGVSWDEVLVPSNLFRMRYDHTCFVRNGRIYVIGGTSGTAVLSDVCSSADGSTWRTDDTITGLGKRTQSVVLLDGDTVIVEGGLKRLSNPSSANSYPEDSWTSTDLIRWFSRSHRFPEPASAAPGAGELTWFGDRLWLTGSADQELWSTASGEDWRHDLADFDYWFLGRPWNATAVANNSMFVISTKEDAETATIWRSENGEDWSTWGTAPDSILRKQVTVKDEVLWYLNVNGITKLDSAWSSTTYGLPPDLQARYGASLVAFEDKLWVIGGRGNTDQLPRGDVWYSTNGGDWTLATATPAFSPRAFHHAFVLNGRLFIAGGRGAEPNGFPTYEDDVWSSADGIEWRLEQASPPWVMDEFSSLTVGDGCAWLRTGDSYWSSVDGIVWLRMGRAAYAPGEGAAMAEFRGRLFAVGGENNPSEVRSTSDGVNWRIESMSSGFGNRSYAGLAVFRNRLWLIGGEDSDGTLSNTVWSTADGANWTQSPAPPFAARKRNAVFTHDGQLWVAGGVSSSNIALYDLWSTEDGVSWNLIQERVSFAVNPWTLSFVPYQGNLLAIGGERIWSSEDGFDWIESEVTGSGPNGKGTWAEAPSVVEYDGALRLLAWVCVELPPFGNPLCYNQVYSSVDSNHWISGGGGASAGRHGAAAFGSAIWISTPSGLKSIANGGVAKLSRSEVDFGTIRSTDTAPRTIDLDIANPFPLSLEPLTVTSVTLNGSGVFHLSHPSLPITILPGAQTAIGIEFAPNGAGSFEAFLAIQTNDASSRVLEVPVRAIVSDETVPPTAVAEVSDNTQVEHIRGGFQNPRGAAGSATIYFKKDGGTWTVAGPAVGGRFAFTPSEGDGLYHIALVGRDALGNEESAPGGEDPGEVSVLWNDESNSSFTRAIVAPGAYVFPMTGLLNVTVDVPEGSVGDTVSLRRIANAPPPPGYGGGDVIAEALEIDGAVEGALAWWSVDEENASAFDAKIAMVYRFAGGSLAGTLPTALESGELSFGPLPGSGTYFAGRAGVGRGGWMVTE